ncbi:hypothetical protein [Lacticaseibacillus rhamnosus]|nr:hypothetical protein [Lacticaseibacillus rhamnosus]
MVTANTFTLTSDVLMGYFYCSLLAAMIALCPFILGMIKKSIIATMATAVLGIIAIQTMVPKVLVWNRDFLRLAILGLALASLSYIIVQTKILDFDK